MLRTGLVLLVAFSSLFVVQEATAQRRVPYYKRRPTISPYVNLFRSDNGGIYNYFTWVRPQLEFQQFREQTDRQLAQQRQQVAQQSMLAQQQLQQAVQQRVLQLRPTSTAVAPRAPAGFMNFGRFYPQGSADVRRR